MADYSDPAQVRALGHIDEPMAAWIKSIPQPLLDLDWTNPPQAREVLLRASSQLPQIESQTRLESTIHVPMRDGYSSELKIHKAEERPGQKPSVVVLIFGGGFCIGSNSSFMPLARAVSHACGATTFVISYRLAPEHPFPVGANDAWDNLVWVAKNAHKYGADPLQGFIVAGSSAGGNLATVITQKSLTDKLYPPVTGQWLNIPMIMNEKRVPEEYRHLYLSMDQNKDSPVVGRQTCEIIYGHLKADIHSPLHSPINAPNALVGLPPTYIAVCGSDPLRDDGLIYYAMLQKKGVRTKLDVFPGAPHIYVAPKRKADAIKGFAWLLGLEPSDTTIEEANAFWVP